MNSKILKSIDRHMGNNHNNSLKAAFVVALIGLASCSGPTSMPAQLADRDGFIKPSPSNEISAIPFTHAVSLASGQTQLDNYQNASLSNFLSGVGRDRGDHYEIRTTYAGADPVTADRNSNIARDLRSSFISQGVLANRIQLVHVADYEDRLELVVRRYKVISPACGVIDVNLGNKWEDSPVQNRDLGCANAYNLGQMVADPRDLVGGRPLAASPGEREAIGVRRHGTGTTPALSKDTTATTDQ